MRLSPKEVRAIQASFAECLAAISFQLYLFGSRLDDHKKGGDIDLLVVVGAENKSKTVELKSKIRSAIFKYLPEQRIDITVASEVELTTDLFLKTIFDTARRLL
jgi:predicted nucleotidyltransferase